VLNKILIVLVFSVKVKEKHYDKVNQQIFTFLQKIVSLAVTIGSFVSAVMHLLLLLS